MNNYIPFGPEWEKEMMKIRKKALVVILKEVLQRAQSLESAVLQDDFSCALINVANAAKKFIIEYNKLNNIKSVNDIKDQNMIALVSNIERLDKLCALSEMSDAYEKGIHCNKGIINHKEDKDGRNQESPTGNQESPTGWH